MAGSTSPRCFVSLFSSSKFFLVGGGVRTLARMVFALLAQHDNVKNKQARVPLHRPHVHVSNVIGIEFFA